MTDHIDTAEERSSKLECITIETVWKTTCRGKASCEVTSSSLIYILAFGVPEERWVWDIQKNKTKQNKKTNNGQILSKFVEQCKPEDPRHL